MTGNLVIWKYPLELTDGQQVMMPAGAEILSVAEQNGRLCLWALVDPAETLRLGRLIEIHGTGNLSINTLRTRKFIGTCVTSGGALVWHVFEAQE